MIMTMTRLKVELEVETNINCFLSEQIVRSSNTLCDKRSILQHFFLKRRYKSEQVTAINFYLWTKAA